MYPNWRIYLILYLIFVPLGGNVPVLQELSPRPGLNIDRAGPYFIKNDLTQPETNRLMAEIRRFLWDHWKKRQTGELEATFYTIEGDPTHYHFLVAPDEKGRWVIRSKSVSTVSQLLKPGQKPKREAKVVIYSVVQIIDPETNKPIRDGRQSLPNAFRLLLINDSGDSPFTL
jgi:hypothetical protein